MRVADWKVLVAVAIATLARGCFGCPSLADFCRTGGVVRIVDNTTVAVRAELTEGSPWAPGPLDAQLSLAIRSEHRVRLQYVKNGQVVIETWRTFDEQFCPR